MAWQVVDTLLATTVMILIFISASGSVTTLGNSFAGEIRDQIFSCDSESLTHAIALKPGTPAEWGRTSSTKPTVFGLAKNSTSTAYELDIDKLTRLNGKNIYSLTLADASNGFGFKSTNIGLYINKIYDVTVALVNNVTVNQSQQYTFKITTSKKSAPLSTSLKTYLVGNGFNANNFTATNADGVANVTFTIPNSASGTTVVAAIAKSGNVDFSYGILTFGHKSNPPQPNGSLLQMSPLNNNLNVTYLRTPITISYVQVYSYSYAFNGTMTTSTTTSALYALPTPADTSPIIIITRGNQAGTYFAEWTTYPQVPLSFGLTNTQSSIKDADATIIIVSVKGVHYELTFLCRSET